MIRVRFTQPNGKFTYWRWTYRVIYWLFSQSQKGKFILRIEDTDQERSKKEFVDEILDSLKWLGFNWDEIYYQSQRFEWYRLHADKLLKVGLAYIERSPEGKEAIIYKVPAKKIQG